MLYYGVIIFVIYEKNQNERRYININRHIIVYYNMSDKKIAIHICFFYIESRLEYIRRILEETNNYSHIADIFIHTNVREITEEVLSIYKNGVIHVVFHDLTGENPFYLAWKCRPLLREQRDAYDIFMYIEDDILVPRKAIEYWEKNHEELADCNYNLGFLRIETDEKGDEFVTDLRNHLWDIQEINGKQYCINDEEPYCAFWIYDKKTFNRWTELEYYDIQMIPGYKIREASAIGLHGKWSCWYRDTVIPVDENKKLDEDCRIYHMPNNYIGSGQWARIPFGEVIQ